MTSEIAYIWLKIMVILFGIGIYFMRMYYHIWETRMCWCLWIFKKCNHTSRKRYRTMDFRHWKSEGTNTFWR